MLITEIPLFVTEAIREPRFCNECLGNRDNLPEDYVGQAPLMDVV